MSERDYSMMIRADAKAIGAVTSTTTRVVERWQGSTEAQRAKLGVGTSECVSYHLDADGNKINGRIFVGKRKAVATQRAQRRQLNKQAAIRQHLLELAGNNSNVD
jgi:hypothetical protein